ncbi:nucleotidyltransferase family protein [Bacterioplanoides sp.]|uniref:nucleotidyltransferase family protein n=1 Tax=Bacterioplanoides sp. TaxID=2066072 RepID=UPI003B004322
MTIGVVLLAAGRSRRFGSDKRLAAMNDQGDYLLLATLKQIQRSQLPCFVVLRPGDDTLAKQLTNLNIEWGICPDADAGMGHSLAFGVRNKQAWSGWLIALADMPWIQPETYQAIAQALTGDNIVRPALIPQDQPFESSELDSQKLSNPEFGNPVAFSPPFAYQLMQCKGDTGARHLLKGSQAITELIVHDHGILRDIDRPADLNPR